MNAKHHFGGQIVAQVDMKILPSGALVSGVNTIADITTVNPSYSVFFCSGPAMHLGTYAPMSTCVPPLPGAITSSVMGSDRPMIGSMSVIINGKPAVRAVTDMRMTNEKNSIGYNMGGSPNSLILK